MNEYMRTAWSSWASGPLDILFVIVVACVALLNLCVIRCSKLRIWYLTFHVFVSLDFRFVCFDFRFLEVASFQISLFECSFLEITTSYFKFADVRFRTHSLMFSNLVARAVEFPRVSF